MKKVMRTRLAFFLAFVLLSTMLTGCGSSKNTTTGTQTATGTTEKANTETGAEAEPAPSGEMTEVGTPRNETLIVECQSPTDTPGQFNSYMQGTTMGFGIHQLMSAMMWEIDTVKGEQFGEVADGMPESNADFTEHTIKIRQGIKWSDGEDLTADDVVFTFNMIMTNPGITQNAYYNQVFKSVEKVDDYTVKIVTKESFPRLAQRFGVTIWGNDLRIVPEHIYSKQADVTQFKDSDPVVAGPYTVKAYDELGKWILYERREDWKNSTVGVVTGKEPQAKYVWFRNLGDDTTRQMSLINNEVDILCEVSPEMLEVMTAQNPNIACWYKDFPYATSDDPCSKGLAFSMGKGAPFDNKDFRWGVALAMNFDEISQNIFNGVGRASPFPILTNTSAGQELYVKPLLPWLKDFSLDLGDGTTVKPFDEGYADRMAEVLRGKGYDIPTDHDALIDMFGVGCWKYDPAAAEKLFIKAGLEKKDDGWYFNGKPFTFNMTYLADTEAQAGRGVQAAYDQLTKFGFKINLVSESSATWDTNGQTGNFDIAGYWPTGFITKDIYSQINGWDADLIVPMGEKGSGQGTRWKNDRATEIIHELAKLSPDDPKAYELGQEFFKISIEELPFIGFHSGVKFVPTNSTYWNNYPNSENPYNGPWWWWSCFKYITTEISPVK
ncbi:ABC transporter substrate-binding protein [Anaerocolumna sedimenticola]|uniref:ABC transporter substrate-binding protein n=1 Tax=Anaerocolumna sedimenticola TaxID=2696063 RepID=A0A6P1TI20_9FIRM|nr:ABC transporter substrate-binding protein [Anaerocolumna sedimenticola]QHQ60794.1 ABC transporter substrate-binding protein [Anaerocolumna sedimenticola]